MLDGDALDMLARQRLGYVATVSPDGGPNVSPKGTIVARGRSGLAFADIRSPDTVRNIRANPRVEISVVDPVLRRGYLFRGTARVADPEERREAVLAYERSGVRSSIRDVVLVDLDGVEPVTSPLYDLGMTEREVRSAWEGRLGP